MKWPSIQLGEICSPKQHPTISTGELIAEGYPAFGANGQIGFYKTFTHDQTTIAITCRGATCGTINVVPAYSYISGNAMALDNLDTKRVDLSFLAYALRIRGLADVISGSAQPQITRAPLLGVRVPLPPLAEQISIAAILDQADELRRKRRASLKVSDVLVQVIFREMFGDLDENPKEFSKCSLGKLCLRISDGTHQAPKWATTGVPFIFVSNVRDRRINLSTDSYVSEDTYADLTKHNPVRYGDVLYTAVGSYGNAAMIRIHQPFIFQRHVAHIKPNSELLDSSFLEVMLESPSLRRQADRVAKGVAQKTVTLGDLKSFSVIQPPLDLQRDFAIRVSEIEQLMQKYSAHLAKLDALFASLQHRAFNGELTAKAAERELAEAV